MPCSKDVGKWLIWVLLVPIFISFQTRALSALAHIKVVTEEFPPYNHSDPNGVIVGHATGVVHDILSRSNLNYTLHIYPWKRSYQYALTEPNTLIYSILRTPQRESLFYWFCPLNPKLKMHFYSKANHAINASTMEEALQYRIGVVQGSYEHRVMNDLGLVDTIHLDVAGDRAANLKKLQAGRVDLIAQEAQSFAYDVKQAGLAMTHFKVASPIKANDPPDVCLALNKQSDPQVIEAVMAGFKNWQRNRL